MTLSPKFTITNRMIQAITRIERGGNRHFCRSLETRLTAASCDRAMARPGTARGLSRQFATQIMSFKTARGAL
ncbi:hypothetical protein SAMN05421880_12214 [Nitrosomonas nitrosa]|uniref:Uncharacterized protein n=1 Tax=Nitrosomonas nitrosa TaxID=52442 RepID=A0A1I4S1G2_9PROT|nr:hypothetical protein SAMN05421880_12214 [Nitrosomonas nitrosa]